MTNLLKMTNQEVFVGCETYEVTVTVRELERVTTFLGFNLKSHTWVDLIIEVNEEIPYSFVGRAIAYAVYQELIQLQSSYDLIIVQKNNLEEDIFYYLLDEDDTPPDCKFGKADRFLCYSTKEVNYNSRYYSQGK